MKRPLTCNHTLYNKLVSSPMSIHPIVIGVGQAGSGKTSLACKAGIEKLLEKKVTKLVITRPAVCVDESLGFLPGDLQAKMTPYMKPIYDCFLEYITMDKLHMYLKNEVIEICPFSFLRGRTFHNCYIIGDEAQNASHSQIHTLLTRIGDNCKTVITGDLSQSDLRTKSNGLSNLLERCDKYEDANHEPFIDIVKFTDEDVIRSDIVKKVVHLYKNSDE